MDQHCAMVWRVKTCFLEEYKADEGHLWQRSTRGLRFQPAPGSLLGESSCSLGLPNSGALVLSLMDAGLSTPWDMRTHLTPVGPSSWMSTWMMTRKCTICSTWAWNWPWETNSCNDPTFYVRTYVHTYVWSCELVMWLHYLAITLLVLTIAWIVHGCIIFSTWFCWFMWGEV